MSTTEPPMEELQLENSNVVPDEEIADGSLSEVFPTSESPAAGSVTSVMPATMVTSVSSSQVLELGQSTPIALCNPPPTSSSPRSMDVNPNVAPHDLAMSGIAHQSLSFGALPRPNMPVGGIQQAPPQTIMRPTPISPSSIQPPAPSQYMGNRPSFGYTTVSHGAASSSPHHQFQPTNHSTCWVSRKVGASKVANQTMNGPIFAPPNSAIALQPPVPMQPPRHNAALSGPVPSNLSAPRLPLPPPRGDLSHQPNHPSSMNSQQPSSEIVKSVPVNVSEPNLRGTVAGLQPMQLQPLRSETVGVSGNPVLGPLKFQIRPMMPSSVLVQTPPPLYQNQIPGHGSVLQPQWPYQPPQGEVFQRAPLQPNLGTMLMVRPPVVLPGTTSSSAPIVPQRSGETHTSSAAAVDLTSPDQIKEANQVPAQEAKDALDVWTAHKTDAGLIYYYNSLTGKSTYEKPVGFTGELEKVSKQSTPVSWEKLPGTDWTLVTTDDGKKYYYDSKNKVSSWKAPPEVAELLKKQPMDSTNDTPSEVQNHKASVASVPAVATGVREAVPLRQAPSLISPSALDTIKKKLQDAGTPGASGMSDFNGSKVPDGASSEKAKEGNGDANISDSSSDSDDGEPGPTKEDCILQFKEMLKEKGVLPFAKWEKELPKIIFDPRFKAVPTNEARRAIFERYVKTRADEERKEKKAAQKAALEGFRQLLEEASEDINHKTNFQEFKKKWSNDLRFKALDRKDREALFNEKVQAAEEKVRAIQLAAIAEFKSMLREKKEITSKSRWSKVKEDLRSDKRYKAVNHEERETLFEEYVAELKAAEVEAQQSSKAVPDEQEKLRERERETRKRKERDEQEMERVRLKIRKKEAVASYQALLVEKIKDPKILWSDAKAKLEKDPQGRATNPDLAHSDAEMLFREHVTSLYNKQVHDFRQLLSEVITAEAASKVTAEGKSVFTSWSEAKRLLQSDVRYSKLSSKDSESFWHRYVEDMARKLKNVLGDLKKEKPDRDSGTDSKEKERPDRDHRIDSPERGRSERDHRRDSKERERSNRDYRRDLKESERSDRDYRRDTKEERSERDRRRDRKESGRSDRDSRKGHGSSDYSRRR